MARARPLAVLLQVLDAGLYVRLPVKIVVAGNCAPVTRTQQKVVSEQRNLAEIMRMLLGGRACASPSDCVCRIHYLKI